MELISISTKLSYCKVFHRISISNRNEEKTNKQTKKQTETPIKNPVYLGISILELSKTLMCDFWYDYIKAKYGEKNKIVLGG